MEPLSAKPRILVLRGGAIGDFIVTLPALQALKGVWPGAEIEIWGYPHIAELAVAGGLAVRTVSLDRAEMAKFFVPQEAWTPEQEKKIRGFDLIVNYLHDPEGQVRSNLLLAGAKQVLSGSPIIKRGHAADFLQEPLEGLGLYREGGVPRLDFSEGARAAAAARLAALGLARGFGAVHPGSGSAKKNWGGEKFADVARRLKARLGGVAVVEGEADAEWAEETARLLPEAEFPRLKGLSLVELGAVLAECGTYVGNDSGVTHLAAAAGAGRVVAVFGPSDAATWAPRGRGDIRVVEAPGGDLAALDVETVWAAAAGENEA